MFEVILYSAMAICALLFLLLAYKYHIDTRNTINELSKDRKLYQRMAWQEIEAREKFVKAHSAAVSELNSKLSDSIQRLHDVSTTVDSSGLTQKEKGSIFLKINDSIQALGSFLGTESKASSTSRQIKKSY